MIVWLGNSSFEEFNGFISELLTAAMPLMFRNCLFRFSNSDIFSFPKRKLSFSEHLEFLIQRIMFSESLRNRFREFL